MGSVFDRIQHILEREHVDKRHLAARESWNQSFQLLTGKSYCLRVRGSHTITGLICRLTCPHDGTVECRETVRAASFSLVPERDGPYHLEVTVGSLRPGATVGRVTVTLCRRSKNKE